MTSAFLKRIAICMLISLVVGAAISEITFYFLHAGQTRAPEVVELDIPAGTADRIAQGQGAPSLPANMTFLVGDTLLVKNQDSVVHQLGPLLIPSGTQASMKLDTERDYTVTCSFQPSKYLGLDVLAPVTVTTRIVGVLETGLNLGFLVTVYSLFAIPVKKKAQV